MKNRRNCLKNLALLGAALVVLPLSLSAWSQDAIKTVAAGNTWVVERTTHLDRLVIAEGAKVVALKGYSLTMTVDGIETPIEPGYFQDNVVLTDTKEILIPYQGVQDPYRFRAALYVNDGVYVTDQSVPSATEGATITSTSASDVKITSLGDRFNGIFVTGDSTYSVDNPTIEMNGAGGNDFAGFGAAIMASGDAKLTVNHANIVTRGAVRTAVWVGGNSTVVFNDANIETWGGKLPADYQFSIATNTMKEIPYGLGMIGSQRSTNLIDTGTVYYNRLHLRAHGWGALSSDGGGPTRMYATNSVIETLESGYGAYANQDANDHFSHCTFNVADYGVVIGGPGAATFTDGTVVNSRKIGVMVHQGTGGSRITIEKGSVFNTKSAAIEIKGMGSDIIIDRADLYPGNGVILQTMNNDDPIMKMMMMAHDAAVGPSGSGGSAGSEGAASAPPVLMSGVLPLPAGKTYSGDVKATIRNATLNGDLIHAMKGVGDMSVSLEESTITGAISTATSYPSSGQEPTRETFRTIGDVKNTLGPFVDKYGLKVSLNKHSRWVVTQTSYLTGLTLANGAAISAAEGSKVTMLVNGATTPIKAGNYTGKIEMRVSK